MKKYFKKFKGIFCLLMCLCIAVATFQVRVFAEGENASSGISITTQLAIKEDSQDSNDVFGTGILTGVMDNDTDEQKKLCYDPSTGENRGYDNANDNNIIRSFDTITYNVKTSLHDLDSNDHTIYYEFIIPNDSELDLVTQSVTDDGIPTPDVSSGLKFIQFQKI